MCKKLCLKYFFLYHLFKACVPYPTSTLQCMIMNIMFNMILEFALFLLVGQNFKDFDLCGN